MTSRFTPDFEIRDGVLVQYHGSAAIVRVPEGVRRIGDHAFTKAVSVNNSGPPPMCSWDGMENPELDRFGPHLEYIGFSFIREVILPDSVEAIGERAFYKCASLEHVRLSRNLRHIGKDAFKDCHRLQSVAVPADTFIEDSAFNRDVQIIRMPK